MRAAMASQGSLPAPSTSTDDLDDEAAAAMPTPVTLSQGHGEIRVNPDLQTILDTGEFKLVRHMVQQQQEPGMSLHLGSYLKLFNVSAVHYY